MMGLTPNIYDIQKALMNNLIIAKPCHYDIVRIHYIMKCKPESRLLLYLFTAILVCGKLVQMDWCW